MLWDWKQKLYAEAEPHDNKPVVSLQKLKAIYGEVPQSAGTAEKKDVKASATKIMI